MDLQVTAVLSSTEAKLSNLADAAVSTDDLAPSSLRSVLSRSSLLSWLQIVVTVFAVVNLIDVLRDNAMSDGSATDWTTVVSEVLGFVAMGVAPWLTYVAVIMGMVPLLLALFQKGGSGVELLVIVPCLIAAGARSPRWLLPVITTVYAAWAVGMGIVTHSGLAGWTFGTIIFLSLIAGLTLRHFVVERTATKRSLVQTEQQLAEAERHLAQAEADRQQSVLEEHKALARELHDGLSHELAIISTQAMGYSGAKDPETVRKALIRSGEASRAGLNELRALLSMLRDQPGGNPLLDQAPDETFEILPVKVENTITEITAALQDNGFTPIINVDTRAYELPAIQQTTVSRILREGSTNIIKHARPNTSCTLMTMVDSEDLIVWVTSQLPEPSATEPPSSNGLGLIGLTERVRLLHGVFEAYPANDRWNIRAVIPQQGAQFSW